MGHEFQRGFIANLQSFRTMVPGGLQFSIEKLIVSICCMQHACTFFCKMMLFFAKSCKTAWSQTEWEFKAKPFVPSS